MRMIACGKDVARAFRDKLLAQGPREAYGDARLALLLGLRGDAPDHALPVRAVVVSCSWQCRERHGWTRQCADWDLEYLTGMRAVANLYAFV